MRYHYVSNGEDGNTVAKTYYCNHILYSDCTLFTIGNKGLAVIQQRYDFKTKNSRWGKIDKCLINDIYYRKGFVEFFDLYAGKSVGGIYPTVSVRQIMWSLRMKPLLRQPWETSFDHKPI